MTTCHFEVVKACHILRMSEVAGVGRDACAIARVFHDSLYSKIAGIETERLVKKFGFSTKVFRTLQPVAYSGSLRVR